MPVKQSTESNGLNTENGAESAAYTVRFRASRPMKASQYADYLQLVHMLKHDGNCRIVLEFSNYVEDDTLDSLIVSLKDDAWHVELTVGMNDFGWEHPLLLGADLDEATFETLLDKLCLQGMTTDAIPEVMENFRDMGWPGDATGLDSVNV